MKLIIRRSWADGRATLGMLTIVDVIHDPIFTLENPLRTTKTDSRIPAGVYKCEPYSGTKYKDVYILKDVPGRDAILIHSGNTEKDTLGCILLGLGAGMIGADPAVTNSKSALELFKTIIGKNNFVLEIKDV